MKKCKTTMTAGEGQSPFDEGQSPFDEFVRENVGNKQQDDGDESDMVYYSYPSKATDTQVTRDFLSAHAFSFAQNKTFGGGCTSRNPAQDYHVSILEAMGLQDEIQFKCPFSNNMLPTSNFAFLNLGEYKGKKSTRAYEYFTPRWVKHMQQVANKKQSSVGDDDGNDVTIAVHRPLTKKNSAICGKTVSTYYPNSYYLHLIDRYNNHTGGNVVIYTTHDAKEDNTKRDYLESMDEFTQRGYKIVDIGSGKTNHAKLITYLRNSDYLIASNEILSHFAGVTAKPGSTVVYSYTPSWKQPLSDWVKIGVDVLKKEREKLKKVQCKR